jgi:hypothetical protein
MPVPERRASRAHSQICPPVRHALTPTSRQVGPRNRSPSIAAGSSQADLRIDRPPCLASEHFGLGDDVQRADDMVREATRAIERPVKAWARVNNAARAGTALVASYGRVPIRGHEQLRPLPGSTLRPDGWRGPRHPRGAHRRPPRAVAAPGPRRPRCSPVRSSEAQGRRCTPRRSPTFSTRPTRLPAGGVRSVNDERSWPSSASRI